MYLADHLQSCGLTANEADAGLLAYLATLETAADEREDNVIDLLTGVVYGECTVQPVRSGVTPPAGWQDLPCAAVVHTHATERVTWAQVCTCMAHIAAAPARGSDEVRALALRFLSTLVQSCEACTVPTVVNLAVHVLTLLPQITAAAEKECRSLPTDWLDAFSFLVRSLAYVGPPKLLCPDAALHNVLLEMMDRRGDEELQQFDDSDPATLVECDAFVPLMAMLSCL